MQFIELLYTLSVIVGIAAAMPQVRQLITMKASDEFSVTTWGLWTSTQACSLAYVITLGSPLLIVSNIIWVSFYASMVYLILHYRHVAPRFAKQNVPIE